MAERLECFNRIEITGLSLCDDVAAVAALGACEPLEARLLVQELVNLLDCHALFCEEENNARVNTPTARAHDQSIQRGQAHRRINAFTVLHSGDGGAVAEMASHEIDLLERLLEPRGGGLRQELVRRTMEAILAQTVLPRDLARKGVLIRAARHRLMKGRIKDTDVRDTLRSFLAGLDTLEIGGVMQRRKRHALLNQLLGDRIDPRRG